MSEAKHTSEPKAESRSMEELEIGNAVYLTRLTNKFKNRKTWHRPDERKIFSFIPGTIQKILVSEGQEVGQGDPMLILEAMKMRNEVLSPVPGVVKKIYVQVGDQVPKDQLLIEFR